MSFCGYCGAEMPNDMKFCTECGKPLFVSTDQVVQPPVNPQAVTAESNTSNLYQTIKTNTSKGTELKKKQFNLPLTLTLVFVLIALIMFAGTRERQSSSSNQSANNTVSQVTSPEPVQQVQPSQANNTSSTASSNATTPAVRTERDGSEVMHRDAVISYCRVSVPFYWGEEEASSTSLQLVAESGQCFAAIQLEVTMNSSDDYSWFKDRSMINKVITERILYTKIGPLSVDSANYYVTDTVPGILCELSGYYNGIELTGTAFLTPSKDYKHLITVYMIQSDNTRYLYNNDFMSIIDTIELTD